MFWQVSRKNPIPYYAYISLLKENNSANNRLPLALSALFYKRRCFYFRICTMFLFYIKISDHGKKKKRNICPPNRRITFLLRTKRPGK